MRYEIDLDALVDFIACQVEKIEAAAIASAAQRTGRAPAPRREHQRAMSCARSGWRRSRYARRPRDLPRAGAVHHLPHPVTRQPCGARRLTEGESHAVTRSTHPPDRRGDLAAVARLRPSRMGRRRTRRRTLTPPTAQRA